MSGSFIVASRACATAAAGILHRDVKPSNLLVRPDGVIALVDFVAARSVDITGTNSPFEHCD